MQLIVEPLALRPRPGVLLPLRTLSIIAERHIINDPRYYWRKPMAVDWPSGSHDDGLANTSPA